jgi:hypothetical protein
MYGSFHVLSQKNTRRVGENTEKSFKSTHQWNWSFEYSDHDHSQKQQQPLAYSTCVRSLSRHHTLHRWSISYTSQQGFANTLETKFLHSIWHAYCRSGLNSFPSRHSLFKKWRGKKVISLTIWNTRRCSGFKIKWKNSSDMFVAGFWIVATPHLVGID